MGGRARRVLIWVVLAVIFVSLAATAYLLLVYPGDVSASQVENRRVFGATYMTMNNPYYQILDDQLRAEIEARGDVLLTRDAAMSQERQNEEIEELLKAGVEAVFLTPVEWDTVREGLEAAWAAKVPVIVLDAPVRDTKLAACSILSDNYQAGVLCARHLLSQRDAANIILLEHTTARSSTERIQGFWDTIKGHEGFTILDAGESEGQIEDAMPVMEDLLARYPEADAVMALNDPSALGALAAIQGAGLTGRFLVYGVDGSPECKALVEDGLMTATCAQFPYKLAEEAVRQGYLALEGGCEAGEIIIPVELITVENAERYGTDGWQ